MKTGRRSLEGGIFESGHNEVGKMRKTEKKEKAAGIFNNYWYLYKGFFKNSRWNILFVVMWLVGVVGSTYVRLYVPKTAVALVMEKVSLGRLVGTLVLMELVYVLLWEMAGVGSMLTSNPGLKYRHVLEEKVLSKICRTAYSNLEDPDYKKKIERAQHLYLHWDRDARECIWGSVRFLELLITIPITSGLLFTLHPAVVAAMVAGTWLQYQVDKRPLAWEKKHRDFWQPLEMKVEYITSKVGDFSYAKDLRLYAADKWLMPKYGSLLESRRQWKRRQMRHMVAANGAARTVQMAREAVVYGILIWKVLEGSVGADDFVLYVGLALSLSRALSLMTIQVRCLKENELSISDYRKMMSMPDSQRGEQGNPPEILKGTSPEITFSHVSFAYPEAREDTLKDVDVRIGAGEKIALVGLNGAGKTTLIKLLCGMYEPTKGEILINGQPASRWDLESWYKLFSVVFQDIGVLPATITENVACCRPEDADRHRVKECLEQAGLKELVESLPHGIDTYLRKEMFREGVNLSGGEIQKLLLARAIYREAPVLVLDEPTAALDAIAENRMYLRYNELTKGRTSIFISHRLSSTRFCDRILMLEGGRITEQGSHEELMEKKGAYYQLFQVQSHYYQNDRTGEFSSEIDPAWEVSSYVSE